MFRMRQKRIKDWLVIMLIMGLIVAVYLTTYTMNKATIVQGDYPLQNSIDANTGVMKYQPAVIKVEENVTRKILHRVLRGIKAADEYLLKRYKPNRIDQDTLASAYNRDMKYDMLEATLLRVLFTGEPLKIGVIGGSISEGKVLAGDQYIYYNILASYLQLMMNRTVEIHSGIVAATDSAYYSYCINNHINLQEVDVVFWELAVNDHVVGLRPYPQEELTRYILQQPSKPQLMYINFINAINLWHRRCVTNERIGSRLLSQHYKIPSINLSNATCRDIRKGFSHYLSAYDYYHPSRRAHHMVALFIVTLFRDLLLNIVHNLLQNPTNQLQYLEKINNVTRASNTIPAPLFDSTRINYPHCWSSLANTPTQLQPIYIDGWTLTENYVDEEPSTTIKETVGFLNKTAWSCKKANKDIVFMLNIDRYGDFLATVSIATIGCPVCGKGRISIDNELEISRVINTHWGWTRIMTHYVSHFVTSGQKTLRIHSLNNKPLTILAIMVAYDMKTTLADLDMKMVEQDTADEESIESQQSIQVDEDEMSQHGEMEDGLLESQQGVVDEENTGQESEQESTATLDPEILEKVSISETHLDLDKQESVLDTEENQETVLEQEENQ
ncbi:uncharacterized protein [Ptychodera flava]|uniref:uncharacterized protein n=1 Tax=Ptychodera flava TaxID=63121 RepID=UPI003969F48A